MKVLAIVLAAVLVASVALMPLNAQAQSATTVASLQIWTNYTDGTKQLDADSKLYTPTGELISTPARGSKQIESFTVMFVVVFSSGRTIQSSSISDPSIKVLAADGTYKTVPLTGVNRDPVKLDPIFGMQWRLWWMNIPRATIENLIGPTSGAYSSDLRVAWGSAGSKITTSDGSFESPTMSKNVTFTASGITGGGGGVGVPTGKLYYTIRIFYPGTNGNTFSKLITQTDTDTLEQLSVSVIGEGTPFEAIEFTKYMFVDNDIYLIQPEILQFASQGDTDNFNAFVNSQVVAKTYTNGIQSAATGGSGLYKLMSMRVQRADIEPMLPEITRDDADIFKKGFITFLVKDAKITMKTPTQTYNINAPQTSVKVDLLGITAIDNDPGPCEFAGEDTDCSGGGVGDILGDLSILQMGALAIGGVITVIGAKMVMRKK